MKKRRRKLKKSVLVSILVIFAIIVILCFLKIGKKENLDYKDKIKIKVGEEIPSANDYILKGKIDEKINWSDLKEDDNRVYYAGEYHGIVNYNDKEITLTLVVIDDEAPIIDGVKDITIFENSEVDLLENVNITDNSHDKINTKIVGEYDIKKAGEYSLVLEATDTSGNKSTKSFKLIVKAKNETTSNVKSNMTSNSNMSTNNISSGDIVGKTSKGYEIKKINGLYYIKGILVANKTYSLPSTYAPGDLISEFTIAFTKMKNDAAAAGIPLTVVSGYRSYARQTTLYNNYVARDGKVNADTYSARPGHSEHQTGLAADLNLVDTSFENTKAGKWLAQNCYKYGFILRYPKGKESITGYIYEPWHFRFIGDEAKNLYNDGNWISLEEYLGIDSKY